MEMSRTNHESQTHLPSHTRKQVFEQIRRDDTICPSRITSAAFANYITSHKITRIVHVYRPVYRNRNATGFGDFVRSCLFMAQFSRLFQLKVDVHIEHPLADFLAPQARGSIRLPVHMFADTNWKKTTFGAHNSAPYSTHFELSLLNYERYLHHLTLLPVIDGAIHSYNILFPLYSPTREDICQTIRHISPSQEIVTSVDRLLEQCGASKRGFFCIHIRCGDAFIGDSGRLSSKYVRAILPYIRREERRHANPILLMADNNEVKRIIQRHIPRIQIACRPITHTGEGASLDREKLMNTMVDFFTMAQSAGILSITSYPHGSGFSYWCARLFDIPYICEYIPAK